MIHLSEENNREEIAYSTFTNTLKENHKTVEKIIVSMQTEPTEVIQI